MEALVAVGCMAGPAAATESIESTFEQTMPLPMR